MATLNKNMLSPVGFSLNIKKTPELNFFVQAVTLPGITIGSYDQPTPFKILPTIGDHITYGDLDVTFKVNEDLGNYIQIFNWITQIGFPDNFDQHKAIANKNKASGDGIYSDATFMLLSSAMQPIIQVEIQDMFPVSLTSLEFNSRDTTIEYIEATVSFKFKNYYFTEL
jgi:hypothetical protein